MDEDPALFYRGLVYALLFECAACALAGPVVWLLLRLLGRV